MDLDEYITNSSSCFYLNLYRSSTASSEGEATPVFSEPFNPAWTYPLINDEETIIGYKDPRIDLTFRAHDLKPRLAIQFEEKLDLKDLPDITQIDLTPELFHEVLPEPSEDAEGVLAPDWTPPGERIKSWEVNGKNYEVWKSTLADSEARRIWNNMKILVLLFIEGATTSGPDDEDTLERWSIYFLYEMTPIEHKGVSPYTLAGFSTTYRTWIFPTLPILRATQQLPSPPPEKSSDNETEKPAALRISQDPTSFFITERSNPLESPSRERISQFLILPPYQSQSLGSRLYETIFADLHAKPYIFEIPVEDPSEDFDAMRDYSDLAYLRTLPAFAALSIPSTLAPELLRKESPIPRNQILGFKSDAEMENLRHTSKIVPRQFARCLEIHLFSTIPAPHRSRARITRKAKSSNEWDRKYYFWRLAMKARIYARAADVLDQLEDSAEKVEKLEQALDGVVEEYGERLEGIARREVNAGTEGSGKGKGKGKANGLTARSKRKRVVVEDEDDEDAWEDEDDAMSVGSKRARI